MRSLVRNDVQSVSGWRAFLGAESGAATLDWLAVAAGGVICAVVVVTMVGDDAIGVVHEMNDRDAVHEAAVAAVAERQRQQVIEESAMEPRRLYYPDAPEVAATRGADGEPGSVVAPSLVIDTRGGGAVGAFEPALAEPEVVKTAATGPNVPGFAAAIGDDAPVLPEDNDRAHHQGCIDAVRANPFVSESLVATAGCDAANGPVLAEPQRSEASVSGFDTSVVIVDKGPAFEVDTGPAANVACDGETADNPFVTDSLRATAGCDLGGAGH